MTTAPSRSRPFTRRGALRLLGGAGVGLLTVRCGAPERAAAPLQDERRSPITFPDGAIIRTVLSDVDPEVLGHGATLFHEHLSLSDPLPPWVPPSDNPLGAFTTDLDLMADEVNATAQEGVSCIVSGGTRDLGQSFERLRALAGRTDMHIVVASGLWTQPRYPPDIAEKSEDQIAEDFLRDATAERWGAIGEIGSSLTMHPDEKKCFVQRVRCICGPRCPSSPTRRTRGAVRALSSSSTSSSRCRSIRASSASVTSPTSPTTRRPRPTRHWPDAARSSGSIRWAIRSRRATRRRWR